MHKLNFEIKNIFLPVADYNLKKKIDFRIKTTNIGLGLIWRFLLIRGIDHLLSR